MQLNQIDKMKCMGHGKLLTNGVRAAVTSMASPVNTVYSLYIRITVVVDVDSFYQCVGQFSGFSLITFFFLCRQLYFVSGDVIQASISGCSLPM